MPLRPGADLTPYAVCPCIMHAIAVTPLLDHFVRDRIKVFGISMAEFWRRLAFDSMEKYLSMGLYQIPDCLLSSPPTKVKAAAAYQHRQRKNIPPAPPEATATGR